MGNQKQFGDKVRAAREKLNLTQEEVAIQAGMNVSYYARLERGKVLNPTLDTLNALKKVLKLKPSDILSS